MAQILIASLGDSPVVVSAMYDILTKQEHLSIDKVIILYTQGDNILLADDLVKYALPQQCEIQCDILPFKDASSQKNCIIFLQRLYKLAETSQTHGDTVYLSLAGGRKSMAALMAWVAPFFTCIKKLYHVLDTNIDDEHLPPIEQMVDLTEAERKQAMHPELDQLILVDIPYGKDQQISDKLHTHLLSATPEELDVMPEDEAERVESLQTIAHGDKLLNVLITQYATDQLNTFRKKDTVRAQEAKKCLQKMQSATQLRRLTHIRTDDVYDKSAPGIPHFFKSMRTQIRPVFYTQPKDIRSCLDNELINDVIVCALEIEKEEKYKPLQEITTSPHFTWKPASSIEEHSFWQDDTSAESVLIVPLGKSPMIATQLYTLLTRQRGQKIRQVVLIYPERASKIVRGAEIIGNALRDEGGIQYKNVRISGLEDINSANACGKYQETLEKEIDLIRKESPTSKIVLALSGGRKGMTAMTIFAAQKKGISEVYHTLITDEYLNQEVDHQTSVEALNMASLSKVERNNRLFLRAYEGNGPYNKFVLFKVPIFSNADLL